MISVCPICDSKLNFNHFTEVALCTNHEEYPKKSHFGYHNKYDFTFAYLDYGTFKFKYENNIIVHAWFKGLDKNNEWGWVDYAEFQPIDNVRERTTIQIIDRFELFQTFK